MRIRLAGLGRADCLRCRCVSRVLVLLQRRPCICMGGGLSPAAFAVWPSVADCACWDQGGDRRSGHTVTHISAPSPYAVCVCVNSPGGLALSNPGTINNEEACAERAAGGPNECPNNTWPNCPPPHKPPGASCEIAEELLDNNCQGCCPCRQRGFCPNLAGLGTVGPKSANFGRKWANFSPRTGRLRSSCAQTAKNWATSPCLRVQKARTAPLAVLFEQFFSSFAARARRLVCRGAIWPGIVRAFLWAALRAPCLGTL